MTLVYSEEADKGLKNCTPRVLWNLNLKLCAADLSSGQIKYKIIDVFVGKIL